MRLVIDGHRLTRTRTGVGRVLEMLLDEWSVTEWPLERPLLVTQEPVDPDRWGGLEVVSAGAGLPGAVWRHLVLATRTGRGDVLFCPTNLLPRTLARRRTLFIFDTLLESVPETFPLHVRSTFAPRYRSSARRADAILVPSRCTADDVVRFYGIEHDRVNVVPLAADPKFWPGPVGGGLRPGRKGANDGCLFLVVGKPSVRRNLGAILQAFADHVFENPADSLVLIGPRMPADPPRGVVAAGLLDDSDLLAFYRRATALLYLSEHEGFGLPIVEAQACGCPVVVLRRGSVTETAGEAALYLDSADPRLIREALSQFRTDPDLARSLSDRGRANASRFSRPRMGREVAAVLREAAL